MNDQFYNPHFFTTGNMPPSVSSDPGRSKNPSGGYGEQKFSFPLPGIKPGTLVVHHQLLGYAQLYVPAIDNWGKADGPYFTSFHYCSSDNVFVLYGSMDENLVIFFFFTLLFLRLGSLPSSFLSSCIIWLNHLLLGRPIGLFLLYFRCPSPIHLFSPLFYPEQTTLDIAPSLKFLLLILPLLFPAKFRKIISHLLLGFCFCLSFWGSVFWRAINHRDHTLSSLLNR